MNVKSHRHSEHLPYPGERFSVDGHMAFLISPENLPTASRCPWVWYAPTLETLPGEEETWMFRQFLEHGIAVGGVDVGESFGSPVGRELFTAFYNVVTSERSLAAKPALLARSRGGLMLYNWAADHPDCLSCIAGIYPVGNLRSYPGLAKACEAYGMSESELEAQLHEHNPIDRLASLAEAKIPLMHIHGDCDEVVPLEENSVELKRRYSALGGEMTLEIVPGGKHDHWSGWFQYQPLVDFILTHLLDS